jgi:glutathione S-transferase
MPPALFAHPFSSYCQKVLVALYENGTPFTFRLLDRDDPATLAEFEALWPLRRFPLLVEAGRPIAEATIIIEHLALHHPGPVRLIPEDPAAALEARFVDRFFDNYVQTPQQKIVFDAMREAGQRDAEGVADARATLDAAYAWLERRMAGREWAAGDRFGLADCAAAPALFYADWTHPIGAAFPNVRAYRGRLNARPSFARAIDEARPYRPLFPLGAPDRD